jgi:excisionase family DNA binding protein
MEELWDVKQTAAHLGLSVRTVYQMARDGRIPRVRVGGRWRFRPGDIDSWLRSPSSAERATPRRPRELSRTGGESDELAALLSRFADPLERRLAFVGRLTAECVRRGWVPPVVVGGQAVEFYSAGGYATVDIDLVTPSEPLDEVLDEFGFERRGRHWIRHDLGLVVEAPGNSLAPGQRERLTEVRVGGAVAYVLGLEDVIVDRLAACVFWSSQDDCGWAEVLLTVHRARLDVDYLRRRAGEVGVLDRLESLLEAWA